MGATKRELFKASEVCEMAQLQPYVLRTWESEFPSLGQTVSGGGGRVYRKADVELVLRIKRLVFGEGLTLAGARRRIDEDGVPSVAAVAVDDVLGGMARSRLRQVRTGLEAIMRILDRQPVTKVARVPKVAEVRKVPKAPKVLKRSAAKVRKRVGA